MFKVGDKIVCIENRIYNDGFDIIKGNTYTVKDIIINKDNNFIYLEEKICAFGFRETLFENLAVIRKKKIEELGLI
jgi:hypothetical protein